MEQRILIIEIQGNIGVGKTSFITYIQKNEYLKNNSIFISEPVEMWKSIKDEVGVNMLEKFYKNMIENAYFFQQSAYVTKMHDVAESIKYAKEHNLKIIFLDRSVQTDMNVFAKIFYDDSIGKLPAEQFINKMEWEIYNKWNDFYEKYVINNCDRKIIYLKCDPQVAYGRIQKRGRPEEAGISLEYLIKLHNYHEKWIESEQQKHTETLVLDWNNNMTMDEITQVGSTQIMQLITPFSLNNGTL